MGFSPEEMESGLGLPPGLLMGILKEGDDWSFVIKAHALVEASISHLLTATLGEAASEVFAYLELSNSRTGKLAFVSALDLLPKRHRAFIKGFSELRNALVHDVRNVTFSFETHLAALNADQRKSFRTTYAGIFEGSGGDPHRPSPVKFREMTENNPRLLVWASVLIVVSLCYASKELARMKRQMDELDREIAADDSESAAAGRALLDAIVEAVRQRGSFTIRGKGTEPA